jgi:hypothetical protein
MVKGQGAALHRHPRSRHVAHARQLKTARLARWCGRRRLS